MYASVEKSYYCSLITCHFSLALLCWGYVNIVPFLLAYLYIFLNTVFEFFAETAYCNIWS